MTAPAMEEEVFTGKMDFALWRKMLKFALPHKRKIFAVMALGSAVSVLDMCAAVPDRPDRRCRHRQGASADLHRYMHRSMRS